jgi:hypothetical protein
VIMEHESNCDSYDGEVQDISVDESRFTGLEFCTVGKLAL